MGVEVCKAENILAPALDEKSSGCSTKLGIGVQGTSDGIAQEFDAQITAVVRT